jgi:basic membrane lipoprotein Med (substrate-binding protein (PBP1-ABC) superfamily)
MRCAAALLSVIVLTACGARHTTAQATTTTVTTTESALRIGVVGPLAVHAPGAVVEHGPIDQASSDSLVLVSSSALGPAALAAAADAHPATHFVLVGGSTAGHRRPNLAGVVIRADQAALLAGAVAGLTANDEGVASPRVVWVGPREPALAGAFTRGVHDTSDAVVVRSTTRDVPVACKEAAIEAIEQGAIVVGADRGMCAAAAASAAHDQDRVALAVTDFELPGVVANRIALDAVHGVFYGNEDVIFGARSGAIGIRRLDPRVPASTAVRAHIAAQQLVSGGSLSG